MSVFDHVLSEVVRRRMTDGGQSASAAANNEDGATESTADVRNVTFIHGDEEDDDEDIHENGEVAAAAAELDEEDELADRVPDLPTDIEVLSKALVLSHSYMT